MTSLNPRPRRQRFDRDGRRRCPASRSMPCCASYCPTACGSRCPGYAAGHGRRRDRVRRPRQETTSSEASEPRTGGWQLLIRGRAGAEPGSGGSTRRSRRLDLSGPRWAARALTGIILRATLGLDRVETAYFSRTASSRLPRGNDRSAPGRLRGRATRTARPGSTPSLPPRPGSWGGDLAGASRGSPAPASSAGTRCGSTRNLVTLPDVFPNGSRTS